MGDNIKDAELKGISTPTARKGWVALTEEAISLDILAADYGTTCLRLTGGRLLIDRTVEFSEDEFYRTRREYRKLGITDIWVVSPSSGASADFLKKNSGSVLMMMHVDRKDSRFVIDGVRYDLAGGLEYVMNGGKPKPSTRAKAKLAAGRLHRNSYPKIGLRPETAVAV